MRTSETIKEISMALLQAQKAIKFAVADATNPHFRSRYADLPSVIDAVKQSLNDAGIVFMQTPSPSDSTTLALCTRLIHVSGEWIEDTAIVPLPKSDPQGYGSALTYARRYSLAAITGLYQDDDDGNAASSPARPPVTMPTMRLTQPSPTTTASSGSTPGSTIEFGSPAPAPPPAPVHPEVAKVQKVFGNPDKLASVKQVAMIRSLRGTRKIDDGKYREYLYARFGKSKTEELNNAEVSDVVNWITTGR
jgi:hypothetical protein